MRAIYLESSIEHDEIILCDKEKVHHYANVLKLKIKEEVLLLSGTGEQRTYIIKELSKKKISLIATSQIVKIKRKYDISYLIALTKKDALDLMIRSCVELGIKSIYLVQTKYSQKIKLNLERIDRIITSAMEQSNNPYKVEIVLVENLMEFNFSAFKSIYVFDPYHEKAVCSENSTNLVLIGPEGGFSTDEMMYLKGISNVSCVKLETPILRAETALNVSYGYIYKQLF
jgi:16S rRNA (uracil1498-N3)-methyltransferase